jgi:hypothetical protein
MTMSMEAMLADLGVNEEDMRSEEFYGYRSCTHSQWA